MRPARLPPVASKFARSRANRFPSRSAAAVARDGRPTAGSSGIRPAIVCTRTCAVSPDGYPRRS